MEQENTVNAASSSASQQQIANEIVTEARKLQEESSTGKIKSKEDIVLVQSSYEESKMEKNNNGKLKQTEDDRDDLEGISLVVPLVQKAELSRSEIEIFIQKLWNKHRNDEVASADLIEKLKKDLEKKDREIAREHVSTETLENERSNEREQLHIQLEELKDQLSQKIVEIQELKNVNVRMKEDSETKIRDLTKQLEESHRARDDLDRELRNSRDNEKKLHRARTILKNERSMEREQFKVQLAQSRDGEKALKSQLSQKIVENQELKNANVKMKADSETKMRDLTKQLEEFRCTRDNIDLELKGARDNEKKLQNRINDLETELKKAKIEASKTFELQKQLNSANSELTRIRSDLSSSEQLVRTKGAKIKDLTDEIERLEKEAIMRVINFRIQYDDMKRQWRSTESELSRSREKMRSQKDKIRELRDELDKKDAEFEEAREVANETIEAQKVDIKKLKDRPVGCLRCPICNCRTCRKK